MGNFPFTSSSSSYGGKKYEPSDHQVNMICAKIEEGFDSIENSFLNRWDGIDEELLSLKIRSRLLKKHPKLASFLSPVFQREGDEIGGSTTDTGAAVSAANSSSSSRKRRKINFGPIIMHNIRVPMEVIANIVPHCDRSSVNNLSLTCRGVHNAIHDQHRGGVVQKLIPWPTKCPWKASCELTVASRGFSRIAVIHRIDSGISDAPDFFSLGIWDRLHGLLGKIEWRDTEGEPDYPAFSPDDGLLIAPITEHDENAEELEGWKVTGIQLVQLPSQAERGPISVSEHRFCGEEVFSYAFVNDDIIALEDELDGVNLWLIDRENGNVDLSFSQRILTDQLSRYAISFVHCEGFSSESKTFLAIHGRNDGNFIGLYDVTTNQSLMITPPGEGNVTDLTFAPDGKLLVVDDFIYAYDCNVSTINEIGQARVIASCNKEGGYLSIPYFSADGMKIAAMFVTGGRYFYHIIDLQKGGVVSDMSLDDLLVCAWDHPAWIDFINLT